MDHLQNGILTSKKEEGVPTPLNSMDDSGKHYAK